MGHLFLGRSVSHERWGLSTPIQRNRFNALEKAALEAEITSLEANITALQSQLQDQLSQPISQRSLPIQHQLVRPDPDQISVHSPFKPKPFLLLQTLSHRPIPPYLSHTPAL
ncbi:hypothetical protein DPMN_169455 [Dreissena polymorpha]|uniref:Uncharacterized protein n=1 Tax=Dreissena polymorpha TaxID=45954 RepID=A0A9D4IDM8_DREPO|nr:hypothetical protein DPMN_169455 [Dreissena polymorpha]